MDRLTEYAIKHSSKGAMIEINQIISELRILEENIDEKKEHTKLTLRVAMQLLGEYRNLLKEQK